MAELGRGGMGVVYLATHRDLGRTFAVKVLSKRMSADPVVVERMRREARTASQLRHPGIVDVTDFGKTPDGRAFIVMEHIEGQNVAKRIATEGAIDQELSLVVVIEVCRALAEAHSHNVIHRDIKPANIIVWGDDVEPRVKVVDFGIALSSEHASDRLTQVGAMPGTPLYMAPEQARTRTSNVQTDVYALGVVLYEMLTGVPPFVGSTGLEILALKTKSDPQPPSVHVPEASIHHSTEEAVLKALSRDPAERFQSMGELAAALEAALEALGAIGHDESEENLDDEPKLTRRFRPTLALVVFAVLAVTVGFVAVRLARDDRDNRGDDSNLALIQGNTVSGGVDSSTDMEEPHSKVGAPVDGEILDSGVEPSVDASMWFGVDGSNDMGGDTSPPDVLIPDADIFYDFTNQTGGRATLSRGARRQMATQLVADGNNHLRARRLSKARVAYTKATRAEPGNSAALGGLGRVAFEQGRYGEATRHLERALRSSPGNIGLRIVLGSAYLRLGQTGRAIAQWERVLRLDPDNPAAARLLRSAQSSKR